MPTGGGDKKVKEINVWRCGNARAPLFEDVVNNARSHRTGHSGGKIVRHGGWRVEDERAEVDAAPVGLGE